MDRVARSRARDRARWLVRDHGDGAEAAIAAKLARAINSKSDRAFYLMIRRELRMLRRIERQAGRGADGWVGRIVAMLRGRSGGAG